MIPNKAVSSYANNFYMLNALDTKRTVSNKTYSIGVGEYPHSIKAFIHNIQNSYTPYYIGIPYSNSATEMVEYLLKNLLEDKVMHYIANPLDKKKEFAILAIACYPYLPKKEKTNVINEFLSLLKDKELLDFLNIQAVLVIKTHFELLGNLFTFSSNLLVSLNSFFWGNIIYNNIQSADLKELLNATQDNKNIICRLVRLKKDKLNDILMEVT